MITKVKIKFISAIDGSVSDTPTEHAIPVVPLTVWPSSPKDINVYKPNGLKAGAYALIDTGADLCYVDSDFADNLKLPVAEKTTVSGATSTIETTVRHAVISFTEDERVFSTELTSVPLISNGRKFQVVFGMQLIKMGALTMDFSNQVFELTFFN
ncbi:retropepsin-like aspartic protease [Enterobacter hormaechei]|uniref:retropepsin-like aspartic protease n=1 Tax=Enterobacter hormaechei TaxID=158836 RepID=UPI000791F7B2|nr:retropepsin-like aspartic protease [Enterobacter hormaechei]MCU2427330.1 retropepsin-like domain-containing protein [Enterobacter hormaechei subsp. hoffmannii]SAF28157.1 Uncharacterised protein [Enterobacter hormaechei]SAF51774.1 Uncharacterised protein [Enterobacter hormaechei]HCD6701787.1 retroviral-like aspartic protease [Enterobacter hormaechei]HCD9316114.1 retroviral-like aspartic protease [Enterobacter hormaechei]